MTTPPPRRSRSQCRPEPTWSCSEAGAYWVRIPTRSTSEWQQLLRTKSTIRYLPPNGTALTARSAVSTLSFSPPPPESTSAMACLIVAPAVSRQGRNRPRQRQAARAATRDLAPAGLPAHRERDEMRGVEVLIVGEVGVVGGEEAMQLGRVVHPDLLPAQAGA